jgi:GNAT superfamily N-acetyltransferase
MELELEIVPARNEELPQVAQLRGVMAKEMGDDWDADHSGWRERFVEYFARRQDAYLSQFFVVKEAGTIVGIAAVSLVEDYHGYVRGRYVGRVNAVYVARHLRRRGIGKKLMQVSIEWLRQRNCTVARLNASEEGQLLYESIGFKPRNEMELRL